MHTNTLYVHHEWTGRSLMTPMPCIHVQIWKKNYLTGSSNRLWDQRAHYNQCSRVCIYMYIVCMQLQGRRWECTCTCTYNVVYVCVCASLPVQWLIGQLGPCHLPPTGCVCSVPSSRYRHSAPCSSVHPTNTNTYTHTHTQRNNYIQWKQDTQQRKESGNYMYNL